MSAVIHRRESLQMKEQNNALALLPRNSSPTTEMDRLSRVEKQVILSLGRQSEDEILITRRGAKRLGGTAWRIEVACDAELVARASLARARRGRGNRDLSKRGVTASVAKKAKVLGCTPNHILKNAQIFRLMDDAENRFPENNILQILDEKGFYVAALSAADPLTALKVFAEKKVSSSRFRVSDAVRYLERNELTKKAITVKALQNARETVPILTARKLDIQHIIEVMGYLKITIIPKCPNDEVKRIHKEYLEELDSYLRQDLFDEDVALTLKLAFIHGAHREDELSRATGFPVDVIHREMGLLSAIGDFIKVPGGSGTSQRWHRVGDPLPPELRGQNFKP
jgi:hypothetical protein